MEYLLLVIFWIILIYYTLKLVLRYLVPWLVKRYINKVNRNMEDFARRQSQQPGHAGMRVDKNKEKGPRLDPDIGEYVDFEEIKDKPKPE